MQKRVCMDGHGAKTRNKKRKENIDDIKIKFNSRKKKKYDLTFNWSLQGKRTSEEAKGEANNQVPSTTRLEN